MTSVLVQPRPAATVLLVRAAPSGFEVLMVRRNAGGYFGGLFAFPGGGVEEVDQGPLARRVVKTEAADRAYRAAALRELAEETGLALTVGGVVTAPRLEGGELYTALHRDGLHLDGDRLMPLSRWVTPESAPRRYDTRFYLSEVGDVPLVRLDASELSASEWVSPSRALFREAEGDWPMFRPTIAHLRWLESRGSLDGAVDAALRAEGRALVIPEQSEGGSSAPAGPTGAPG